MALFIFIVVVLVIIIFGSAGTSLGRALLPRSVTDAVSKLLPQALIRDATANVDGETIVLVGSQADPKTVHVRRRDGMTIAWTYATTTQFPHSGTFAFTSFQHNLKPGSTDTPAKVKARVQNALTDALAPKQFQPAERDVADIWISVFGALEGEVKLENIGEAFNEPDGHEWGTALRIALTHDSIDQATTFARGSLMLEVVDSRARHVLWQAVAMADIVVDVSESERDRRIREAIGEIFKKFPPRQQAFVSEKKPMIEG